MKKEISSSNCAFLVKDESLKAGGECDFVKWLMSEGYCSRGHKGRYSDVNWIFINISTKVYAPGMPGIEIAGVIGNHCVTIDEFKIIHNIFKKYEGTDLLRLSKKEQDEWSEAQMSFAEGDSHI